MSTPTLTRQAAPADRCAIHRVDHAARPGATARKLTRETLQGWSGCEAETVDNAVLVVCELVTNADRYTDGEVLLRLRLPAGGSVLEISVQDEDPSTPQPAESERDDESGRGLCIVEALSVACGCSVTEYGKRMWAQLPLG